MNTLIKKKMKLDKQKKISRQNFKKPPIIAEIWKYHPDLSVNFKISKIVSLKKF